MIIKDIMACSSRIVFELSDTISHSKISVTEHLPLGIEFEKNSSICESEISVHDNCISIPRFYKKYDRITNLFEIMLDGIKLDGMKYVTKLDDVSAWNYDYPQPDTIKALGASGEDIKILGIKQSQLNINLPAIMTLKPKEEDISYECNGNTYYFVQKEIKKIDKYLLEYYDYGVVVTAILLNSPKLFDSGREDELLSKVIHPDFDWNEKSAYISAFNMRTEEGQEYYKAFVEFLVERYAREDAKYGRMCGMIISNEVNSQYVWGNAGEMDVSEYTKEYTVAMRLAWLSARKHYNNFRVYMSLDHFWTSSLSPEHNKRFYKGRDIIDYVNKYSREEGNFAWNVAYHPYPENLFYPDFYNDRSPTFDFSTVRITFKNLEVLPAYLSQTDYLFENKPRRIILSEQGFNSKGDSYSEKQGAAAYCLAYQKAKKIDTIDFMTHHAYIDNRYEFGLNLGIRRLNDDDTPGEAKPIYYMMRDMDTEMEEERVKESRAFIGEELYDMILNPSITYGEADRTKESQFQEVAD